MAFGNIDSPPVTDFGAIRNPTGQGSCCMATRTLDVDIKLLVDTLEVEPWYSPGAGIGSGGIQTSRFDIIDVKVDWCGSCNPGTQGTYSSGDPSECDCPHENKEAFPPFTIKLSSPSCKKGWGKAVKEQAAAAINNALKNVQVGGCACSNCEGCMPYGELNSKIMTVGEAFSAAINALGQLYRKQSSGRGPGGLSAINAGFIKQFDEEPNLCP